MPFCDLYITICIITVLLINLLQVHSSDEDVVDDSLPVFKRETSKGSVFPSPIPLVIKGYVM